MFHISMGTLHHYEQEGILTPEYTDERTGYRYYSARQFEVLNTIWYLRVLDIPLSEIGEFLKNRDVDVIEEKLVRQKELIEQKKRELDLEYAIRNLEENQKESMVFLGKIGVEIPKAKLEKRDIGNYQLTFLVLDEEDCYEGQTEELPETRCVTIRFCGSHREAGVYYKKLLDYIDAHRLQINGFSREITLIDYGMTSDPEKFVTEIRIPIA